jgi:FkbM family methyltransferase
MIRGIRRNSSKIDQRVLGVEQALGEVGQALGELASRVDSLKTKRVNDVPRDLTRVDRRWREHLLQGVKGLAPFVGVEIQGTVYFFSTADPKSGQTLFIEQGLRRDQAHLRRAIDALEVAGRPVEMSLFVDVGAHIGTTTLYAIRNLGFDRAIAIEPGADNVRLLRMSLIANGLEGVVHLVHAAVSNETGTASLNVSGVGSEYHHLVEDDDQGIRQIVPTVRLDQLIADGVFDPADVGLIWMDIEGYEIHALEGANSLLQHAPPLVLEACSKKLERTGKLKQAPELLGRYYTHALDIRKQRDDVDFVPVSEFSSIVEEYAGHCADVLVCRQ